MSAEQARRVLMAGLPPLDPALVEGLLAVTGRWPLLLRLVNENLKYVERDFRPHQGRRPSAMRRVPCFVLSGVRPRRSMERSFSRRTSCQPRPYCWLPDPSGGSPSTVGRPHPPSGTVPT